MCGRFALYSMKMTPEAFEERFGFPMPDIYKQPLSYNIGPYREIPAIHIKPDGTKDCRNMFWQLVPSFAKEFKSKYAMFNSRSDSFEKTGFKQTLLRRQRCVVLMNHFFEWRKENNQKIPYRFNPDGQNEFSLGGIFSIWRSPEGEDLYSCSLITVDANEAVKPYHHRMPLILTREAEALWLDATLTNFAELSALMQPYKGQLEIVPVSTNLNSTRNDSADLVEPV